jgi:hypothetical protein
MGRRNWILPRRDGGGRWTDPIGNDTIAFFVPIPMAFRDPPSDIARLNAAVMDVYTKRTQFFVGGCPKSGTTWVQILLNAHPEISCIGEGHLPNHLLPLLRQAFEQHSALINDKNATIFRELPGVPQFSDGQVNYVLASAIALLLMTPPKAASAYAIGERTPDNHTFFPLLATLFPAARFIHVVRDGRDCTVSAWFHNKRVSPKELARDFASLDEFIEPAARFWATAVAECMAWCETQTTRCMLVRYEDLATRPGEVLRQLFRFLGVATSDEIVAHCIEAGAFNKLTGGRPAGREDPTSLFRRGLPGDWRNHLSGNDNARYLAIAGDLSARLGYP